jgi:hypothetical protein
VRVHYPRWWPRYGKTAPRLLGKALLALVVGFLLVRYLGPARLSGPVGLIGLLGGVALLGFGLYVAVRTVIDLAAPATLTGEVLWMQPWRSSGGQTHAPWLQYLAVDDGTGDATRAWGLPTDLGRKCRNSDTVTITSRRWSRRITTLTVVQPGARRAVESGQATTDDTEALISGRRSGPGASAASPGGLAGLGKLNALLAAPAVAVSVESLLSAQEVGQAVGVQVTEGGGPAAVGPLQSVTFVGSDGAAVLAVAAFSGPAVQLAMRARRGGTPLVGIGDEAFVGPGWAVARVGQTLIALQFRGSAAKVGLEVVRSLLSTAVARLSTATGAGTSGAPAPEMAG